MHYDVIVIGAGPAGCMSARMLSAAGFKVLLLERARIPREKACGGFLPPEAVGLIEDHFGTLPEDCLAYPDLVRGARLLCEGGGSYDLPFSEPGRSVMRSRLDAFMADRSGAEIRDGCEALSLKVQRFLVRVLVKGEAGEEEVESTYLIGADGAESLALGSIRPEFYRLYAAPRLERTMFFLSGGEVDWDPEWMGLFLLRRARGIGRLMVRDDLMAIAVNYDVRGGWQGELDALSAFLHEVAGLQLRGEAMRQISASNRMGAAGKYNLGAGCALLAGEAAGLLDPWGFGIHLALESGRLAAESLIESAGESITPHIRYSYRMQDILQLDQQQRRRLGVKTGCLETSSLAEDRGRIARRDRRLLRRRFTA